MRHLATAMAVVSLAVLTSQLVSAQDTTGSDSLEQFERVATRYHAVLARQPRRGTAFDMLFRQYLDAGKLDKLVAHYENASKAEPDNYAAHLVLGLIYERRGLELQALAQMRRAIELSGEEFYPYYYEAQLLSGLHRDDEAVVAFERALENNPPRTDLQELFKQLGRLHARQGEDVQALKVWSRLADDFPNDRFAVQELAELLAQEEQFDEAIQRYQQLGELAQGDVYQQIVARIEIGQIQVLQGKLKTAIETFESCLAQVKPDSWLADDIRRRVERIFLRSDDLSGLVEYYTERLEKSPDDLATMTRRAAALAKLGNTDKAIQQYRQAVDRAPTDHAVRQQLVSELIAADKPDDAIKEASVLVEQNPTDVQYLQQLGDLYLTAASASGEERTAAEENALQVWQRIADIRPDDAALAVQVAERCRAGAQIGSRYAGTGNLVDLQRRAGSPLGQAALAYYQEAARRDPSAPRYYEYLGEFQHAIGKTDEAITAWKKIAAPPRDTIDNLRRLAEVLEGADEIDLAVQFTQQALQKDTDQYDLHALASRLLTRQEKYDDALLHIDALQQLADSPALQEQAINERVELYVTAGRLDQEREKLEKRLIADDATVHDFWLAGMMASAQRKWTKALEHFDAAIALNPKDMRLLRGKAETHQRGGDLVGAASQYRRLAEIDTRGRSAHLRTVVDLELDLGRIDAAQQAAEELIRFLPGNVEAVSLLARVYFRAGKQDEALDALRSAVRLNPRDIGAREVLARALAERDQGDEAIEHYWRAFQLADDLKDKISVTGALADQYVVDGRFEKLIERFEQARRNQEDSLDLSLCLAEAFRRAEDYTSARRELRDLLARRPNDVQVLGQLVALSEALDDLEQASVYLENIVELAPERTYLERLAGLYQQLNEEEKAAAIWKRLASEAKDELALLSVIDRAELNEDFQQVVTLAEPRWNRHRDDWRFGYRLVWALWQAEEYEQARAVALTVLKLAPTDKYQEKAATTSSTAQASYYRSYPREMMRVQMPQQIRSTLAMQGNTQRNRGLRWKPQDLVEAQMFCTVATREMDRKQKVEDGLLSLLEKNIQSGDTDDADALRQVAWIYQAEQKLDELLPLYRQWLQASPHDPEPRIGMFYVLSYRVNRNARSANLTFSEEQLAELAEQYHWLLENRADLGRWIAGGYVQLLVQLNKKDEALAIANRVIDEATDVQLLSMVSHTVSQLQDPQLMGKLLGRLQQLQQSHPTSSARGINAANLLQQIVQLARQSKDWDQLVKYFDQYMDQTNPTSLRPGRLSNPNFGYATRSTRQSSNSLGPFPSPSIYLDGSRLPLLQSIYQSLKSVGEIEKLVALVDRRITTTEGTSLQCWKVCRAFLFWWEADRESCIELLEAVAATSPGLAEPHILKAKALAASGDVAAALEAIKDTHVSFGPRAKELEKFRMELALRGASEEVAKRAALRLFGMRLTSNEQVRLVKVLRQLGLDTRSQALIQRVVTTSRTSASQIHQIMLQQQSSDPRRAATIARRLLRQVSRASQPNNSNNRYRLDALRLLKQVGELDPLVARAEQQLSEAPKSLKLLGDLAEYYEADGRDDDVHKAFERIVELRPDDANVRYRIAQHYFQRQKHAEGVEQLDVVWKKDPQLILNRAYEIGQYYASARKMDTLAEHVRSLKGSSHLQRYGYQLTNLMSNLSRSSGANVDDIIKTYEAIVDAVPDEQRANAMQQLGEYLARQNRKQQAFDLYRQIVFPQTAESEQSKSVPNSSYYMIRLADLAKDVGQIDSLRKESLRMAEDHDDWEMSGKLLICMLKRRAGDEEPLVELGTRYLDDENLRNQFGARYTTLREELANCDTEEALRTAIRVWESMPSTGSRGTNAPNVRIANIWVKIGDREQARMAFLASREYQPPVGYSITQAQDYTLRHRLAVADAMRQANFYLEAIAEYDEALRTDTSSLQANSYIVRSLLPRTRVNLRQAIAKVIKDEAEQALAALEAEVSREDGEIDLAPFFVVADPMSPEESRRYGSSSASELPKVDGVEQQLLPRLLEHANKNNRLTDLAEKVAKLPAMPQHSDQLIALQTMVSLAAGNTTVAHGMLEDWVKAVEEQPALSGSSQTWLLAQAALRDESTRTIGLALSEQVAASAGRTGNLARQQAALAAILSASDEETSSQYLQNLLAKGKGDANVLLQVARVHFDRKQYAEGVKLLEPAWKLSPEILLPLIRQLGPQYGQAGKLEALAEAIRGIHDPDLASTHRYDIPNMFREIPREERNVDGFVDLYLATLDFGGDAMKSYATSQFYSSLSQFPKTAKVLAAYERAVFPSEKRKSGQLENLANGMLELAEQLKELDRVESKCQKAREQFPVWRPEADLLLAMIGRRQKSESRFVELAQRYENDNAYAAAFSSSMSTLRNELRNCTSPQVLQLAARLWQQAVDGPQRTSYSSWNTLAQIWLKLEQPQKAHQAWMEAMRAPTPNYDENYRPYYEFQRRSYIADRLRAADFHMDAIRLYAQNQTIDFSSEAARQYDLLRRVDQQRSQLQRTVHQALTNNLDELLADLVRQFEQPPKSFDLSGYFVMVSTPWTEQQQAQLPQHVRDEDAETLQLLPAVLRHAHSKNQLTTLAEEVIKALAKRPDDSKLAAVSLLIHQLQGRTAAVSEVVSAWIAAAKENDAKRPELPEMLLVARATIADPATNESATRLIAHALDVALSRQDLSAQWMLWELTLGKLADEAQRKQLREEFPEKFSQLHQWLRARAGDAEQRREWDAVVRYLNLLVETDPTQSELIQRRGKAYVELGEFRKAIEDFGRLLEDRPNDAELLVARGEAYTRLKQWEQAAVDFNNAIQLRPDDEQLRAVRGRCYANFGVETIVPPTATWRWLHPQDGIDPATADSDFHTTFFTAEFDDAKWHEDNDSPGPRGGFGYGDDVGVEFERPTSENRKTAYFRHTFATQDEYDSLSINMQRDDGVIIYLDGVEVHRDNVGTGDEAYDLFADDTISGNDETASMRFALAGNLAAGKHVLAVALHNRADGSSDLRIAEISLQGKKIGSASLVLDDPEALIDRGNAYLEQEQPHRAADDFSQALKLDPRNFRAHLHRARGYLALGKNAEAHADVEEASSLMKELKVKNQTAEQLLIELRKKLSADGKEDT